MDERARKIVVAVLAVLTFLAPLKFTHPVILYRLTCWPSNWLEWAFFTSWPNPIFYALLIPLAVFGLGTGDWKKTPAGVWLPSGVFLAVQILAASASVDRDLSRSVLWLFFSLAAGYLLGARALKDENDLRWITSAWLLACLFVAGTGISQASGGLEETRRYLYEHPEWAVAQPELWNKVTSNRVFSSFVNPNALGGYIASAMFVIAAWCSCWQSWLADQAFRSDERDGRKSAPAFVPWLLGGGVMFALLYCLWKSQSKGAYAALFLTMALAVLLLIPRKRMALGALALVLTVSVVGFGIGYGQKAIEKGQKTWGARMGYWRAAWKIGLDHPVFGSGPGTFSKLYPRYKRLDEESTRLAHNNYLQMWCDSGLTGFVAFAAWLPGSLWLWRRRWRGVAPKKRIVFTLLWCGCAAFALHSLVDFDLYMLSNSWPVFVLLGCLTHVTPRRTDIPDPAPETTR
ncbi:MAG: O-antigen ligase family protein [Verrucomicrobia bacterium]|nr:O-antigen ligase family protein [Verrucomicrobiota bacterium]